MRLICASVAMACAATAVWAETFDVSGTAYAASSTVVVPISDGFFALDSGGLYDRFESDNPDNILIGASGPCFGAATVNMGRAEGGGVCTWTDPDNEVVVMHYQGESVTAEGVFEGTWRTVGGTGKWDGATGSGRFASSADGEGRSKNVITGEVDLP